MTTRDPDLGFSGAALLILSALVVLWLAVEHLFPRAPLERAPLPSSFHGRMIDPDARPCPARSNARSATGRGPFTEAIPS